MPPPTAAELLRHQLQSAYSHSKAMLTDLATKCAPSRNTGDSDEEYAARMARRLQNMHTILAGVFNGHRVILKSAELATAPEDPRAMSSDEQYAYTVMERHCDLADESQAERIALRIMQNYARHRAAIRDALSAVQGVIVRQRAAATPGADGQGTTMADTEEAMAAAIAAHERTLPRGTVHARIGRPQRENPPTVDPDEIMDDDADDAVARNIAALEARQPRRTVHARVMRGNPPPPPTVDPDEVMRDDV